MVTEVSELSLSDVHKDALRFFIIVQRWDSNWAYNEVFERKIK